MMRITYIDRVRLNEEISTAQFFWTTKHKSVRLSIQ